MSSKKCPKCHSSMYYFTGIIKGEYTETFLCPKCDRQEYAFIDLEGMNRRVGEE